MKNTLKVDMINRCLVMDRTFAQNASYVGSREYEILQRAKADYPNYEVVRRQIKRNPQKESYAGLTYAYMRDYIYTHEPKETRLATLDEFEEMILISKCHSKGFRYSIIKSWFLNKYPKIKEFTADINTKDISVNEAKTQNINLKNAS